jgi:hypothetical protein
LNIVDVKRGEEWSFLRMNLRLISLILKKIVVQLPSE